MKDDKNDYDDNKIIICMSNSRTMSKFCKKALHEVKRVNLRNFAPPSREPPGTPPGPCRDPPGTHLGKKWRARELRGAVRDPLEDAYLSLRGLGPPRASQSPRGVPSNP